MEVFLQRDLLLIWKRRLQTAQRCKNHLNCLHNHLLILKQSLMEFYSDFKL